MYSSKNGIAAIGVLIALTNVLGVPIHESSGTEDHHVNADVSNGFMVIANASIPCAQMQAVMTSLGQSEPYKLTEQDKQAIAKTLGLRLQRDYLAENEQLARDNFVNLLPLTSKQQDNYNGGSVRGGRLLKKSVLRTLKMLKNRATYAESEQSEMLPSKAIEQVEDEHVADAGKEPLDLMLPDNAVISEEAVVEGVQSQTVEYCFLRGSAIAGGQFLRLCTVCAATRVMTADYWPRYINEAMCSTTDFQCLVGTEDTNGMCYQVIMPITLLRRSPDQCVLVLQGGQTLVAENWELTNDIVSVGCECAVNSNSHLARYA